MRMLRVYCLFPLALLFVAALSSKADVRLSGMFSDNMVLQRDATVPIWGWADEGEQVTVEFQGKTATAKAKDGKWMVKLSGLKAGGPNTLVVKGHNKVELANVVVGEVWVCSGQSNMEFAMSRAEGGKEDIANSANPNIRLFQVPHLKSAKPLTDLKGQWKVCSPASTTNFTAVGYYFGRDLQKALNVPVGLIQSGWGGSPAEVWTSERTLQSKPEYQKEVIERYANMARPVRGTNAPKNTWKPSELYNGMISPLEPFAIKGVIWYQGEANASRAKLYRNLFPDLIKGWRDDWKQGDFPFVAVQLAPYDLKRQRTMDEILSKPEESTWAELREAQWQTTKVLPKVGMAVITDVGEKDDIHPKKKRPVGARLALAARAIAYGEKIEYSGPTFKKMNVKHGKAVISFDHADSGLEARGGPLTGFSICGEDGKYAWAQAQIDGDKVIVSSSAVSNPVAVRYGWADFPVVNLWNRAGLPACPFRTDEPKQD
jgi:sialate O-acetylesterase